MYGNVPSLLENKPAQMFTSGDFTFVATMKSKSYGGIGLMDLCDKHVIPEELIYDNSKEGSMPGIIMQRIMRNFYII